ncbi:ATPase [Blastomonas marina]|uniref:ATPase n=1 Tax=Blastomonas marina TaxID=1867408 RepID=A0ABQ1F5I3_9SPHN|nr:ATP-binding protein [Blastomonas marina]GFZ99737.1 ATPase [Blastomonas marina]
MTEMSGKFPPEKQTGDGDDPSLDRLRRAAQRGRPGHLEEAVARPEAPQPRRDQPAAGPGQASRPSAETLEAVVAAPADRKPRPASGPEKASSSLGANATTPIGKVVEIAGSGSRILLDLNRLHACSEDDDPSIMLAGQVGSQVKIRVGKNWLLASVRTQKQDDSVAGGIVAAIDFLGEGNEERLTGRLTGFRRGVTTYPVPGSEVFPATSDDLRQIYASDGRANVQIGKVFPTKDIRAGLYIDAMLGKHFALLGSTGTGKSTGAALILHRICQAAPEGHIVMIDPHGEYSAAFRQTGMIFDVSNLQMPYWLMNFDEHCEVFLTTRGNERQTDADILARCLLKARQKSRLAEGMNKLTVDSPIPYLLSDLTSILQDEMGKLDKASSSIPYMRIKSKIDELKADPRYQFMFSGMLVGDTMAEFIGKIFRLPAEGKPISIVDVSGVPSDITSTVVAVLSRLTFDYAIWSRDEKTRPILLVCEEAHRYVPNEKNADGSSVGNILSRIAKEGRKYGVSLGLITQRPSDLAEGVLSQCGTIISMRLNNDRDQAFVKAAMPEGARGFLDSIPALRNRECIICGEGVSIPVRVSFDTLEEHKRPASEDPSFAALWNDGGGEEESVGRTVARWRSQGR